MTKERVDIIQNNDIGFVLSKAQYEINGCTGKDWVFFSKQASQCSLSVRQACLVVTIGG